MLLTNNRLFQRIGVFILLSLSSAWGYAAECSEVFPDGISSSRNSGEIRFFFGSQVLNSPDNILDTRNLTDSSGGVSCNGVPCTDSNTSVPTGDFNTFPGGSNINVGFAGSLALAPGDYGSLTIGSTATLQLSPGQYTFREIVTIGFDANIELSAAGSTQFLARRDINISSMVDVNTTGTDRYLFMFTRDDIAIGSDSTLNAVVYARDQVSLTDGALINGAVTARGLIRLNSATTVDFDASRVTNQDFGAFCTQPTPAVLIAGWSFDESSWSGTAGEVIDIGPNALNGVAVNNGALPTTESSNPVIAGNPGTCRYGQFDQLSDGYVEIADPGTDSVLDTTGAFSVALWMNPASFSSLQTLASKDINWEFHTNTSQEIFWWWGGGARSLSTTGAGLTIGSWHHVVIAYESGNQNIYIDGVIRGTNNSTDTVSANNLPVLIGTDWNFHSRRFNGLIDEVRIYDGALTQAEVDALMLETQPCALGPDHYAISFDNTPSFTDANGLTCQASSVWVYGHDAADALIAPVSGTTLDLSTSTSQGYWSNPSVGSIVDSGSGNAVYTFAGNDSVELRFNHTSAGAVNFAVSDSNSVTESVTEDPTLTFFDTGFRFVDGADNPIPNQVSGQDSADIFLQAVRLDTQTGSCTGLFSDPSNRNVRLGAECSNPSNCAGEQVSITNDGTTALTATSNDNGAAGAAAYTTFNTLLFGADSKAALTLEYPDAGAISLHAEHDILNDDATDSGADLTGSSNVFVVKPYTLAVSNVPSNPATTSAGLGFVAAGESFTVQVEARNLQGDRTPNFGNEAVAEGVTLTLPVGNPIYPAAGDAGGLNNAASFSAIAPAGTQTNTTLQWTEVGTIQVQPRFADGDYLGAGALNSGDGSVLSSSGNIGRFYPHHFQLTASNLDNSCASGNFTYMSQPLDLSYTLQAQSALSDALVTNYDTADGWLNAASLSYQAEDSNDGSERNIANRVSVVHPSPLWVGGEATINDPSAAFLRQLGANPEDGPFLDLDIGVRLADTLDSRVLEDLDMDSATVIDCAAALSCTAKQLGSPLRAYFGRMTLKDAFGPETADIPMFWQTEYYDGTNFVLNTEDSCTALASADVSYAAATSSVNSAADTIDVNLGGVVSEFQFNDIDVAGSIIFANGLAGGHYGAPTPTTTITYDINVNLTNLPYLTGDWNQDTFYGDQASHPVVHVRFNHYRGSDRIIYWRELFEQ